VTVDKPANAAGWNNSAVVVTFHAAGDNGPSGVASCTSPITVSAEGTTTVEGVCTDRAGNVSDPMAYTLKIDTSAPNAPKVTLTPAPNAAGWNNGNVVVSFADKGDNGPSGIASCNASVTVTDEGSTPVSGTCADAAGNVGPSAGATVRIDKTAPTVNLTGGPAEGASYYYGSVPAAPSCSAFDALSGLTAAGCQVSGYDTSVGGHTVTASATDVAGNVRTATVHFTVLAWTAKGFYSPVDMGGTLNVVKGGSTVPLKFELFSGSTELTDTASIAGFKTQKVSCTSGSGVEDPIELTTTGGTSLRYDATAGQFVQNWKTPTGAGTCYSATMTAQDGSSISALFKLK
jgi:hypothetical protein